MEGLVLLLGEAVAYALSAALAVALETVGAIAELLLAGGLRLWERIAARGRGAEPRTPSAAMRRLRRVGAWAGVACAGLLALTLAGIALLDLFFFEASLRWIAGRIERRTGIELRFASARGSFFGGRLEMAGVTLRRADHAESIFDLSVREVAVRLSVFELLAQRATVDELAVTGVRGRYARVGAPGRLAPRRRFEVRALRVADAELAIADRTRPRGPIEVTLRVDSSLSRPLRSQLALFDALFHTSATGTLAGRPFSVETHEIEGGRETCWRADALPLELFASYVGGRLGLLSAGKLDVDVQDRWSLAEPIRIEMHWKLTLRELETEIPADLPEPRGRVASKVVAFLSRHAERLPLEFHVVLDASRFEGRASLEAAGLWEVLSEAVVEELSRCVGLSASELRELGASVKEKFKRYLERRRRSTEQP